MLPSWLAGLLVIFLVIALVRRRPDRHPHLQALLAVVLVLAYEGVHSHVI
jgi:4-amino-4-deoxy-L-arabinose transferase-like glycosyltransferase